MIYVTEDQAASVQYLIQQAIQGNHVLFDSATMKKALRVLETRHPSASPESEAADTSARYGVEHHIEKLMTLASNAEKRAYFEKLDEDTFAAVVRTYFNIVENSLYEARKVAH